MILVIEFLVMALELYKWIVISTIIVSWLVAFDVMNTKNPWVYKFCALLNKITDPALKQVRRVIPPFGGMDLSPIVIIFGISILQNILWSLAT